jgi:hypothetical protein
MHLRSIIGSLLLLPLVGCSSDEGTAEPASFQDPGRAAPDMSTPAPPAPPGESAPPAQPGSSTSTDGIAGMQAGAETPLDPNAEPPPEGTGTPPEQLPPTVPAVPPGEVSLACSREFTVPTLDQLSNNPRLPDPFTFFDGTPVLSTEDWVCRQKEIRLFAESFIFGRKPGPPDSLTASFANGTLTIDMARNGQAMTMVVPVTQPNGTGPFPGIVAIGGAVPEGVANIAYGTVKNGIAAPAQGFGRPAPSGDFYRLYPEFTSTGSLMAWAWGASRIVDALEQTVGQHNIDPTRLSSLGCSRDGKASATIGLFDERFALVAARSPGSGTTSAWRIAYDELNAGGSDEQTAAQIFRENTWLGEVFAPFAPPENAPIEERIAAIENLPIDQHLVLALAWPRPLIMMEGTNDSWNCPLCSFETMSYTRLVYEALGTADAISFPQPAHGHCAQAGTFADQFYGAFVDRFLRGDEAVSTAGLFDSDANFAFDANRWQDGDVPTLQ